MSLAVLSGLAATAFATGADEWSPAVALYCPELIGPYWGQVAAWDDPDSGQRLLVVVTNFEQPVMVVSPFDGVVGTLAWGGPPVSDVASADVTGDGTLDLVLRTFEASSGTSGLGAVTESGDLSAGIVAPLGITPGRPMMRLGDTDADGREDVSFGPEVWVGAAEAPYVAFLHTFPDRELHDADIWGVGDLDGDGHADLGATDWSPGYPYNRPYGPLDIVAGASGVAQEVLYSWGPEPNWAYGRGAAGLNVDEDPRDELVVVAGRIIDDYGGTTGAVQLVDDAGAPVALATLPFESVTTLNAGWTHKILPLNDRGPVEPARFAWAHGDRIEEIEVTADGTGAFELHTVRSYTPPIDGQLVDVTAADLDGDGSPELVALGIEASEYHALTLVVWSTSGDALSAVRCSEEPIEEPPADTDPPDVSAAGSRESCGCGVGDLRTIASTTWIVAFAVCVARRPRRVTS